MKICISNGRLIDPKTQSDFTCDIWIDNQKITQITKTDKPVQPSENVTVIDATGKWVVPGLIDLHVHFREPGFEHKEDIQSGCKAAAKGGFTTVCCMPNTKPAVDCREIVELINSKTAEANGVEVLAVGAITKSQSGGELADFAEMLSAKPYGICAISEDGKSVMNAKVMNEAMKVAKELNLSIYSHAEDENMGTDAVSEEIIVARDILLAKNTGCKLHFCHISTKGSVDLIRWAKSMGINVTAETAPHYFTLTKDCVDGNTFKKMNPPLRTDEDRLAIIRALQDGTLDAIATDHAPHSTQEKQAEFNKAPFGVIGLETSFAASYTNLVKTGLLTPMELVEKMSTNPAQILGMERGSVEVSNFADLAVIDVDKSFTVNEDYFASKSINSAFMGETLYGEVLCTIAKGRVVYDRQVN